MRPPSGSAQYVSLIDGTIEIKPLGGLLINRKSLPDGFMSSGYVLRTDRGDIILLSRRTMGPRCITYHSENAFCSLLHLCFIRAN